MKVIYQTDSIKVITDPTGSVAGNDGDYAFQISEVINYKVQSASGNIFFYFFYADSSHTVKKKDLSVLNGIGASEESMVTASGPPINLFYNMIGYYEFMGFIDSSTQLALVFGVHSTTFQAIIDSSLQVSSLVEIDTINNGYFSFVYTDRIAQISYSTATYTMNFTQTAASVSAPLTLVASEEGAELFAYHSNKLYALRDCTTTIETHNGLDYCIASSCSVSQCSKCNGFDSSECVSCTAPSGLNAAKTCDTCSITDCVLCASTAL